MRVLVTGSREWTDRSAVIEVLRTLERLVPGPHVLIHGDDGKADSRGTPIRGLDRMAGDVADGLGWDVEPVPAAWELHGSAAGPLRNEEMVYRGADLCLAFPLPGSVGTWDCIARADEAGIPVVIVDSERQKAPAPWRHQLAALYLAPASG